MVSEPNGALLESAGKGQVFFRKPFGALPESTGKWQSLMKFYLYLLSHHRYNENGNPSFFLTI